MTGAPDQPAAFRLFRVTNTANTGSWVAARDADEARAHFVAASRARRIENTRWHDVTDATLANPTSGPDLPRMLAAQTYPVLACLRLPAESLRDTLRNAAAGIAHGPRAGTWEVW